MIVNKTNLHQKPNDINNYRSPYKVLYQVAKSVLNIDTFKRPRNNKCKTIHTGKITD